MPTKTAKKPVSKKANKGASAKASSLTTLIHIGRLISRMREDRKMTQSTLAEMIGTTQSVVARIEKGEQNLSTETLSKISTALDKEILSISSNATSGTVNFRIEGGRKLSGEIMVRTSKNGALGVLCASLLNKGVTILKNAPKIEELYRIIEVVESIGVGIKWIGKDQTDLEIRPPKEFNFKNINIEAAMRTRSCIMLIGPLIHHAQKFQIPQPSGCRLGSRTVKPHFYALEKLGVSIETASNYYEVNHKGLKSAEIVLFESGDTLTENVLIAAALTPGKTVIKYASANYQVQDVCFYLQMLGVKIEGIGTTTLTVHGVESVDTPVTYYLGEDPIEAMSLITAAIITQSQIIIRRCPINFLEIELLKLEKMGLKYKILSRYKGDNGEINLVDIETFPSKLVALEEKIHASAYPGLNMDNLPFFALIATQAEGETLIHDWSYEERAIYYKELDKLRAQTVLADPHRIFIKGPTQFKAAEIVCPPALRPSVIIMLGMLAAKGTSVLRNVYNINRGYEDLAERLNKIGAKIETFRDL